MNRIYVFGVTPFAEMLKYYIEESGKDKFCGYVVDEQYMPKDGALNGHTVLAYEQFVRTVSPDSCQILSSVTYNGMNKTRETIFNRIKNDGYSFGTLIHPSAIVANNCKLGEGNIILENVVIQPFTEIGDNNVFWSNVNICHHTVIGSFNFFAASSVVLGKVEIKDRCFIGCNSTIKNRTVVESDTLIGAAAYSAKDIESGSVLVPQRSVLLEKNSSEIKL